MNAPTKPLDIDQFAEIVGTKFGSLKATLEMRIEAIEAALSGHDRLKLSLREWEMDQERTVGKLEAEIGSLQAQLNAMQAENDILRQCLSPKDTMKAADAISMLRSIR